MTKKKTLTLVLSCAAAVIRNFYQEFCIVIFQTEDNHDTRRRYEYRTRRFSQLAGKSDDYRKGLRFRRRSPGGMGWYLVGRLPSTSDLRRKIGISS